MAERGDFGPQDETSLDILLEKTFMASGYLTGVGFGFQLLLYLACVKKLWHTRQTHPLRSKVLIPYLSVLCAMNLIWTATSAYGLQLTFIDNRNYPGGPLAFLGVEFALPANITSLSSYIVGNILADGLMIWRCYLIWSSPKRNTKLGLSAALLPSLMLVASFILAILFAIQTTGPPGLFAHITASFAVPYFTLSMALNIVVTILISYHVLKYERKSTSSEHPKGGALLHAFFESAALYSIVSLLLLVTFAIGHPIHQIWLGIAPSIQLIANYIIIYRAPNKDLVMFENSSGEVAGMSEDQAESHTRA